MITKDGECRISLPIKYPRAYHLQRSEPMLLLSEDSFSGVFVVIAERDYKTNPYLRNRIKEFLAQEAI